MSLDGVKAFVKSFNAVIKDKLRFPSRSGIPPELLAELERSCRFGLKVPNPARDARTPPEPPVTFRTTPGGRDGYTYSDLTPVDYDRMLLNFNL